MIAPPDPARLLTTLSALIAIPSENPPGGERAVAQYIRDYLAPFGFTLRLEEYAPERFNVEAVLCNGAGPVFAFNTHMDTVPAGSGWTSDPFVLSEREGRLFGRGSCDCKGPLAAMLEALRLMAQDRASWSGTVMGVFTGDEEVASEGAKHYRAQAGKIDMVVVGEPTGNTTVCAHKGSFRPRVRVFGKAAHSGSPHLGENAIFGAGALMPRLAAFHDQVLARRSHPLVGSPSLTVTRISGGHADNVIPEACEMLLDRRLIPGETDESAVAELEGLLHTAAQEIGVKSEIVGKNATTGGAAQTAIDAQIVQMSIAACEAAGVLDAGPFGFQGACDLVHFIEAGASGTVIGAGDIRVAHKPDEFVPKAEFITSCAIYRDIAQRVLGR
ncbi:Acetylornithine deacetylase [Aquimixticola soesokkakensis]|uniref:Acetylornithine deacetylase n=1 Tax=Aquimixticola soesokkakensis TaxID=1519096 RepID=A0A1Y5RWS4_9RHOB|nr:M20 family metallopeptidase [Aquimixticola soesokkakensis]SLN27010.1 Acetylornithine deacetylase [Aquimixticola soesokkakensis]